MNIILTGITGTLAPFVLRELEEQNHTVTLWRREDVNLKNRDEINAFIKKNKPDYFLHLATGPEYWVESILNCLIELEVPLLWTSSEAVFGSHQIGPFKETDCPEPTDEYGKYKRRLEEMILDKYSRKSHILRLGWQIGDHPKKNNMLAYFVHEKKVEASSQWILSTSFMADTAKVIVKLLGSTDFKVHHVDSNDDNLSFYQIAMALKKKFQLPVTIIERNEPKRNNRLLSEENIIGSLSEHF